MELVIQKKFNEIRNNLRAQDQRSGSEQSLLIREDLETSALRASTRDQDGISTVLDTEVPEILSGAGKGTRFIVRSHDALDAAAREDDSEHAGAGSDVERQARQRSAQRHLRTRIKRN